MLQNAVDNVVRLSLIPCNVSSLNTNSGLCSDESNLITFSNVQTVPTMGNVLAKRVTKVKHFYELCVNIKYSIHNVCSDTANYAVKLN